MLPRTLEPEVMDSEQDAREYQAIDNDAVNADFVEAFLALAPTEGVVLDLGTGPAHIPLLLLQRSPGLRAVAVDLSTHMLDLARDNVARSGLGHRIELAARDVKNTQFPARSFDAVICNSLVHHIPDPVALFREIVRVARPGAALLIKDLLRPGSAGELEALVARYAARDTPFQRELFHHSLHAALRVEEVVNLCARAALHGVRILQSSDRHWEIRRSCPMKEAGAEHDT
jgi:ubiquinone/menaquinone biosynthesis C-methylase UbiE